MNIHEHARSSPVQSMWRDHPKLLAIQDPSKKQVKEEIIKICTKYALERIPRNYEILSTVKDADFAKLKKVLLRKPAKTASGVSVVALMPKPYACPHGRCTYCPGGIGI